MERLRWIVIVLGALTVAGGAVELAMERHWGDFVKLIPWMALGAIALALIGLSLRPRAVAIRLARLVSVAVIAASAYGVWEHVRENHKAGPLDFRYSESWSSMSSLEQWTKALTKAVGPAPVLAPGLLGMAALCVLAASYAHPAMAPEPERRSEG